MGGGLKMLIDSAAGGAGRDQYAQTVMCAASALSMGSATLTKMTHRAERQSVHDAKVAIGLVGTASHLPLWALGSSDLTTMVLVAGIHAVTTVVQLIAGHLFPSQAGRLRQTSRVSARARASSRLSNASHTMH